MKKTKLLLSVFIFSILILCPATSLEVPPLKGPVMDNAGIMNAGEKQELEAYLRTVQSQTGIQLAVLTLNSLQGDSLESFSIRTAEKWQLGEKGKNNGVLLLVVMSGRSIRIETGYGLEHLLTDAKCGLIIRNIIAPQFQKGSYGQGIIEGCKNIIAIAGTPEKTGIGAEEKLLHHPTTNNVGGIFLYFCVAMAVFFIVSVDKQKKRNKNGFKAYIYNTGDASYSSNKYFSSSYTDFSPKSSSRDWGNSNSGFLSSGNSSGSNYRSSSSSSGSSSSESSSSSGGSSGRSSSSGTSAGSYSGGGGRFGGGGASGGW